MSQHWTSDPKILQLVVYPSQLIALGELRKISLAIEQDKEKWNKFFEEVRKRRNETKKL